LQAAAADIKADCNQTVTEMLVEHQADLEQVQEAPPAQAVTVVVVRMQAAAADSLVTVLMADPESAALLM
jgi:hypothetical protein